MNHLFLDNSNNKTIEKDTKKTRIFGCQNEQIDPWKKKTAYPASHRTKKHTKYAVI